VDGLSVTDPRTLEVAAPRLSAARTSALVDGPGALGARAAPIVGGVFEAELAHQAPPGPRRRGHPRPPDAIESSIRAGVHPRARLPGRDPGGQIVNLNADVAAQELALAIQPSQDHLPHPPPAASSTSAATSSPPSTSPKTTRTLHRRAVGRRAHPPQARRSPTSSSTQLPRTSSVSITSPELLARELFTHKGSGTLVRRGERITLHATLDTLDRPRLAALLTAAFGRPPVADYFERKQFWRVYLADSYRAGAVLTHAGPVPYLDKFAVTGEAQGEGIGGSLWQRLARDVPRLYWRARTDNAINPWYFQRADGSYTRGPWTVFWTGLFEFPEIQDCVERALAEPPTLEPAHSLGGAE
jgi:acetylglutamate synthase